MDVREAITSRRAVKHFDPQHRMSDNDIRDLLSLATQAPTAFNIQHWRFVVVQDQKLREKIRAATWMQSQVTDASLFIVLCADLRAWEREPERYWKNAPTDIREGVLEAIEIYYRNHEQVQRDEAMRSCGIAAQTIMLAAKALGYDSCPMDLADMDEVAKLIHLPEDHVIAMFLAVGKSTREPWPRAGQLDLDEVVLQDSFQTA